MYSEIVRRFDRPVTVDGISSEQRLESTACRQKIRQTKQKNLLHSVTLESETFVTVWPLRLRLSSAPPTRLSVYREI